MFLMSKDTKSFLSDVKNSKIKQPTQIGFSAKSWKTAFDSFENISEQDEKIYLMGLWTDKYLNSIRSELKKYNDKVVDLIKLRQMYVATLNRDYCVADTAIKEHLEYSKEKGVVIGAIPEKKFPIGPDNFNVHLFGAIEAGVGALRFPLSETFRKNNIIDKGLDDLEILQILLIRINLASTYSLILNLWGESLWSNWGLESADKLDLIRPPKSREHLCRVVSEHRFEALNAEFSYHTINIWAQLPKEIKNIERDKKRVISIERRGKRKVLKLGVIDDEAILIPELSMAIASEEQYWDQLLEIPLPNYPNITIRDLVKAWGVFSSLGRVLKSKCPKDTGVNSIGKLLQFSPRLNKSELLIATKKATGFSHDQILSIIDLCTFSGDVKDDPWLKPFIQLEKDFVCFLIPPLIVSNRIRLIENWMREGGLDLNKRGCAFEDYVRGQIENVSQKSKYMSDTFVSLKSIKLSIEGKEEEIDFIWIIGSLILIGEIKCSLFPTSPIEFHNFFYLLDSATHQVKRKVDYVKNNLNVFYKALAKDITNNKDDIVVEPIVITNLPFGSGFPINDVPITDLRILIRYIEGFQKILVSTAFDGNENSTKVDFFKSKEEAQKNILPFLNQPLTIKLFLEQINSEIEPIWKFNNGDKDSAWLRIFIDESKINHNKIFKRSNKANTADAKNRAAD